MSIPYFNVSGPWRTTATNSATSGSITWTTPPTWTPTPPDPTVKTVETKRPVDADWEKAVIAQAGGTCEYVSNGTRCTTKAGVRARSWKPGSKDPSDGTALCPSHWDPKET
jgi:hypothetical protein